MADTKVTDLTESAKPRGTDILYIVENPHWIAVNRKVQIGNLAQVLMMSDTRERMPNVAHNGTLFIPSDGYLFYRYKGAGKDAFGPIYPLTEPENDSFFWINQNDAVMDDTHGGVHLSSERPHIKARVKRAPNPPYVITTSMLVHMRKEAWPMCGLCFRQDVDGRLAVLGYRGDGTLCSTKYASPISVISNYATREYAHTGLVFLRIADDGKERICSFSADGKHWEKIHSVDRDDFITADQVGFFISPHNSYAAMTLLSWKETADG